MRVSIPSVAALLTSGAIAQGVQICKLQKIDVNTAPVCKTGSATAAATTGSDTSSVTEIDRMASRTSSPSVGRALVQTAGPGLGLGIEVARLLAAL